MSDDLFDFRPKTKQFAVFGNPIGHSKSPQIHQRFAQQFGMQIEYQATLVEPGGFNQAVQHFKAVGGLGLNITVPFKVEAFNLVDELSPRAKLAEAVNTLHLMKNGEIFGDNTDGYGLIKDLQSNLNFTLENRRILVIGAGGAVRGVLGPLLEQKPALVQIVNRTEGKALDLAAHFDSSYDSKVNGGSLRSVSEQSYDLIINGTAASLSGELPDLPSSIFHSKSLAYDMMYSPQATVFMRWALDCGALKVTDGLGMLVEQAAESFRIWNDETPATPPVIEALRQGV